MTNAITEMTQLVLRERQCRVRGLVAEMRECFHPDATVTTSRMRGGAAQFAESSEQDSDSIPVVNRLGGPVVHHQGRRAIVELPSTTTWWMPVHGVEARLTAYMRVVYRVEERDGVWRISDLAAINEGDTLESAVPGTTLDIDREVLSGFRHSYRFLAFTRQLAGETISPDLFGTDRPGDVGSFYADAFAWRDSDRQDGSGS